jgi:hypothetical protein
MNSTKQQESPKPNGQRLLLRAQLKGVDGANDDVHGAQAVVTDRVCPRFGLSLHGHAQIWSLHRLLC